MIYDDKEEMERVEKITTPIGGVGFDKNNHDHDGQ